ncbi:MAG: hypothetical protein O2782_20200 [bacterium]|nr:hypothetical protein [bacterium]
MQEGDLTHDEINAALEQAEKTIIFARQNRLRDGVLLPDDKLPRFHAGHDSVRFFYSAVRQLPEYFLDAMLARDISVTLVVGTGMLCFRDVRNWCAVHAGRTRRTIYLPERILEVAHNNCYDYWSIAHILVTQGWKLLDFALLREMIEAVRQQSMESGITVVGHAAFRRLLKRFNRHRSTYESPALRAQRDSSGIPDAPINEAEAFMRQYEPRFVYTLSSILRSGGAQISSMGAHVLGANAADLLEQIRDLRQQDDDALSSDAVAKLLWDDYFETTGAQQQSEHLFKEMGFPDFFLLDRDILHPAARDMAEAAGQQVEPQNMAQARHDYRDSQRFGIGVGFALERLLAQAPRFGADGILGLMEEVEAPLFETGQIDKPLEEAARGVGSHSSQPAEFYVYLGRGLDLIRLRDTLEFWRAAGTGEHTLRLQDLDVLKRVAITLSAARTVTFDTTVMQVIDEANSIHKLIVTPQSPASASPALRALIIGEAHRLLDANLEEDERVPSIPARQEVWRHMAARLDTPVVEPDLQPGVTVWQLLTEQLELALVRAVVSLDLVPDYPREVARLVRRGQVGRRAVQQYIKGLEATAAEGADLSEREAVLAMARRALAGDDPAADGAESGEVDEILVGVVQLVEVLLGRIPERYHACTSGKVSPIRRVMKQLQDTRRRHPTSPELLGYLSMILVRLADEGDFDEVALALAEEISGKSRELLLQPRLVFQGD